MLKKNGLNDWCAACNYDHNYPYDILESWGTTTFFPHRSRVAGVRFLTNSIFLGYPVMKEWKYGMIASLSHEITDLTYQFFSSLTKFQKYIFKRIIGFSHLLIVQ